MNRRAFLKHSALVSGGILAGATTWGGCAAGERALHTIPGALSGPNAALGHRLRSPGEWPPPTRTMSTGVLIIGGGVSGLAARRALRQAGRSDVLLVELEDRCGGNARSGRNAVSAYPLGAHYLPLPNRTDRALLDFLQEAGCITGYDRAGLPVYNPYYLCHDPMERLFLNGRWTEGLVPTFGVSADGQEQIARFFRYIHQLKGTRGADGRPVFAIPNRLSSQDPAWTALDRLSYAAWLRQEGYTAPALLAYLDYGCRDDFGATLDTTSAWAGLHYHAARTGEAANAASGDVLVWPEGNAFLVQALQGSSDGILSGCLAHGLRLTATGATVQCLHNGEGVQIHARQVVLAAPQHVVKRLLRDVPGRESLPELVHSPWIVTNLVTTPPDGARGAPLCWDNVLLDSRSVGYVNACHQHLNTTADAVVLSHYWPLTDVPAGEARAGLAGITRDGWLEKVLVDLAPAHPDLRQQLRRADVWIWGHGMVQPRPGLLSGGQLEAARAPFRNTLFFAHTDWAGMSLFEEAFDQGRRAAAEILQA